MEARTKARKDLQPPEIRLEILRGGEQPYLELRPGIWTEALPGIWVNLQKSDMHGCELLLDAREV